MVLFLITRKDVCPWLTFVACLLLHFISPSAKNLKQEPRASLPLTRAPMHPRLSGWAAPQSLLSVGRVLAAPLLHLSEAAAGVVVCTSVSNKREHLRWTRALPLRSSSGEGAEHTRQKLKKCLLNAREEKNSLNFMSQSVPRCHIETGTETFPLKAISFTSGISRISPSEGKEARFSHFWAFALTPHSDQAGPAYLGVRLLTAFLLRCP